MGGGGVKSLFPIFSRRDFTLFPVEISILVDPLNVFCLLSFHESEKQKKKKSPQLFSVLFTRKFEIFLLSFFIFSSFPSFPFPLFLIFLYIFHFFTFFLASFFLIFHQKFPGGKSLRGTMPPTEQEKTNFELSFYPSPSSKGFSIFVESVNLKTLETKVTKQIIKQYGKEIGSNVSIILHVQLTYKANLIDIFK